MIERYLENFEPGQIFRGFGRIRIDKDRMKSFAAEFDPQPFHLEDPSNPSRCELSSGLTSGLWLDFGSLPTISSSVRQNSEQI